MTFDKETKAGFQRPAFIGWTIFQIMFAENLIIQLRDKFGRTADLERLEAEIPEGEEKRHRARRTFEDWRKEVKSIFKI